jgi:hypothetical protein
MLCVEYRRQGQAESHALENRRAHNATYWAFFKKIEYLQDNKGLIYWGRIKAIKDYTNSFRIDFERRYGSTKALLGQRLPEQETIDNYRKRKAFLEQIKAAASSDQPCIASFMA